MCQAHMHTLLPHQISDPITLIVTDIIWLRRLQKQAKFANIRKLLQLGKKKQNKGIWLISKNFKSSARFF